MSTSSRQMPGSSIRARLLNRGAYQWYAGTLFGLAYQAFGLVEVWTTGGSLPIEIASTIALVVVYAGYVVIPPLVWPYSNRARFAALIIYWLATFALFPLIGTYVVWVWPLVVAMLAFSWLPNIPSFIFSAVIVSAQVIVCAAVGWDGSIAFSPFVTVTVLISLFGITRQIIANRQLRDAQATIAVLAAAEERARLARDLHDVLGHSLTVVAVKSELAGRLVDSDPSRAAAEIADIESLARAALADLRAAVTSYREMSLDSELRAARTALEAAGIEPHLPESGNEVDEELRPLFGWVVREGVTNVIRHSGARSCWVELQPQSLRVRDDGSGAILGTRPGRGSSSSGNGLTGLGERAREVGAEVTTAADDHGFVLIVERAFA